MKPIATLAALSFALCACPALAGLYKWVDENGRVHYTQTKPTKHQSLELNAPPPPPSESFDLNKPFAEQIRARSPAKPGERAPAGQTTSNSDLCATVRANLSALQNNARVRYKDKEGNLVIMPEDVRQQKLKETQEQIGKYCE